MRAGRLVISKSASRESGQGIWMASFIRGVLALESASSARVPSICMDQHVRSIILGFQQDAEFD